MYSSSFQVFQSVRCDIDGNWDENLSVCPSDNEKTCDIINKNDDVIFDCVDTFAGKPLVSRHIFPLNNDI